MSWATQLNDIQVQRAKKIVQAAGVPILAQHIQPGPASESIGRAIRAKDTSTKYVETLRLAIEIARRT